jgi:hypothetical protein
MCYVLVTRLCLLRNAHRFVVEKTEGKMPVFFYLRVEIGVVVKQTQGIECAFVEWIKVAQDNDTFRTTSPDGWNFGFHWRPWIYWLADYFFLEKVSVNNKLENKNLSSGIEHLAVSVLPKARFELTASIFCPEYEGSKFLPHARACVLRLHGVTCQKRNCSSYSGSKSSSPVPLIFKRLSDFL